MSLTFGKVRSKELPQLYEMLWRSYEYHFKHSPKDFFKPFVENNVSFKNENFFVMRDGEKIVSAVQVFLLEVYFDKRVMKMGGIGQVATLPEYRGKGLSKILLKKSIEYMKDLKIDYSLLFAGSVKLYEQFGWKELPIKNCVAKITKKEFKKIGNFKIKKFKDSFKYDVFEIHNNYIKNFNNCIIRNPLYWEKYFWGFKGVGTETYVLKNNEKKIVSYITFKKEKKSLTIYEYGSLEFGNLDFAEALINFAIKKKRVKEIYVPYINSYYEIYRVLNKNFNCEINNVSGFMLRNINSKIDWTKAVKRVLFFLGDSF